MGLFDVLPTTLFTTSETMVYNDGIYELLHELPNDLRLKILGNQEISGKFQNPVGW